MIDSLPQFQFNIYLIMYYMYLLIYWVHYVNSHLNSVNCLMVLNATFNNMSVMSWRSVLLVEETEGPHHCVQTDPAKNVLTRAYLIPERNRTVRRQEEGKNSVFFLFFFLHELGGNKCFINHFLLSDETVWLCHRILIEK